MHRVSKGFFLGCIGAGYAIVFIVAFLEGLGLMDETMTSLVTFLTTIFIAVIFLILIYRSWGSIPEEFARTTPGKAVGFMFIPFFNLYWFFQAIWGLAKDYNNYIDSIGLTHGKLNEGLFLAYCILAIMSLFLGRISYMDMVLGLPILVLLIIIVNKLCDAINNLPELSIDIG